MVSEGDMRKFNFIHRYVRLSTGTTRWFANFYNGSKDLFWQVARKRARELRLLPKFEDELESFMERVPPNAIGVHVRRTDLKNPAVCDPPLMRILDRVVEEEDPTFLFCTDNPSSLAKFRERYGERILWREQEMRRRRGHRARFSNVGDAAIDVYALSRTKRIIGTERSSFSCYAAFLGDIQLLQV